MTRQSGLRGGRPLAVLTALLMALIAGAGSAADPPMTFVTLGTSESLYYDVGRALCSVIDESRREHGIRCSAEPTPGSVYNLERLVEGDLDFALAQSDAQFAAFRGEGDWAGHPFTALRSVMSLQPELLTLLVRADSGVSSIGELRGKRLNVGNPGSGTRATWDHLQAALGWGPEDLRNAVEMRPGPAGQALCAGKIDSNLMVVGHPSPIVAQEVQQCPHWFIQIQGADVEQLIAERPYYTKGSIAKGLYGLPQDVHTFGGRATLVTRADAPEAVVHDLVTAVLADLEGLRASNPALATLDPAQMARDGLSAPLHPGAERAFRERGAIP